MYFDVSAHSTGSITVLGRRGRAAGRKASPASAYVEVVVAEKLFQIELVIIHTSGRKVLRGMSIV